MRLKIGCVIFAALLLGGCQSPSTRYTNGLIFWYGSTAVGIGWGEYTEVAAGGKLKRTMTGKDGIKSTLIINNSLTPQPTNRKRQADGADLP
jgi:hypothetical protein